MSRRLVRGVLAFAALLALAGVLMNPVVEGVLRSERHGLMSHTTMLLGVTDRSSGEERTFPVSYKWGPGGEVLTASDFGWWRELRGGADVTMLIAGEELTGRAVAIEDDRKAEKGFKLLRPSYYKLMPWTVLVEIEVETSASDP